MFEHRGVAIRVAETNRFAYRDHQSGSDYDVTAGDGLFFMASSEYGKTFATTGPEALDLAKRQIDAALK